MKYEIFLAYQIKSTDGKKSDQLDETYNVEKFLSRSLKKYHGQLLEYSGNEAESKLVVDFEYEDDAEDFNDALHEFLAPRMYLDTEESGKERYEYLEPKNSN